MSQHYKTRRDQLRGEIRKLMRRVPQDLELRAAIRSTCWDCARIAGCAQRDRTIQILREHAPTGGNDAMTIRVLLHAMTQLSVEEVWDLVEGREARGSRQDLY